MNFQECWIPPNFMSCGLDPRSLCSSFRSFKITITISCSSKNCIYFLHFTQFCLCHYVLIVNWLVPNYYYWLVFERCWTFSNFCPLCSVCHSANSFSCITWKKMGKILVYFLIVIYCKINVFFLLHSPSFSHFLFALLFSFFHNVSWRPILLFRFRIWENHVYHRKLRPKCKSPLSMWMIVRPFSLNPTTMSHYYCQLIGMWPSYKWMQQIAMKMTHRPAMMAAHYAMKLSQIPMWTVSSKWIATLA